MLEWTELREKKVIVASGRCDDGTGEIDFDFEIQPIKVKHLVENEDGTDVDYEEVEITEALLKVTWSVTCDHQFYCRASEMFVDSVDYVGDGGDLKLRLRSIDNDNVVIAKDICKSLTFDLCGHDSDVVDELRRIIGPIEAVTFAYNWDNDEPNDV